MFSIESSMTAYREDTRRAEQELAIRRAAAERDVEPAEARTRRRGTSRQPGGRLALR